MQTRTYESLNLSGIISAAQQSRLMEYTRTRFQEDHPFRFPEAFALLEQNFVDDMAPITKMMSESYGVELQTPNITFVPTFINEMFRDSRYVPISYNNASNTVTVGIVPELEGAKIHDRTLNVNYIYIPIHLYLDYSIRRYGRHPMLAPVPAKDLFSIIAQEALEYDAADITITSTGKSGRVYYNVRKKKIYSGRRLDEGNVKDLITYICAKDQFDDMSARPKRLSMEIDTRHRGRVLINKKSRGYMITIRILPLEAFSKKPEELNLTESTLDFYRNTFMNKENGLRIIVGETMSGKNTTALALLQEEILKEDLKVVSIERPVEQYLEGVEQIDCANEIEYRENIQSLIRSNPDFVYITEIDDATGLEVIKVANTDKRVLSTIHANSPSGVINRLCDITGYNYDRIITAIHSICYQRLVRNDEEDKLYPRCRYVYLSKDRKRELAQLPDALKLIKIDEWEDGDEF